MIFKIVTKSSKQNAVIALNEYYQLSMTASLKDIVTKIQQTDPQMKNYYNTDIQKYTNKIYSTLVNKVKQPLTKDTVTSYIIMQYNQFLQNNTLIIAYTFSKYLIKQIINNAGLFFTPSDAISYINLQFQDNPNVSKIPWDEVKFHNFDVMLKTIPNGSYQLSFDIDVDFTQYGINDKEEDDTLDFSLFMYNLYKIYIRTDSPTEFDKMLLDICFTLFINTYSPNVISNSLQKQLLNQPSSK